MDDFEVVVKPNFKSGDHYEVLGCTHSADSEELTKAYRDLSRKYHPENRVEDDGASQIFAKVAGAYASLVDGGVDEENQSPTRCMTTAEAKDAYVNAFGRYRKLYYDEGGIIGLPYAYELRELMGKTKWTRETFSWGTNGPCHVKIWRSWLIKKDIDITFAFGEIFLTSATTASCILSFFVDDDDYRWYIDVFGGVALLMSCCLLSFWYGFTRYPVLLEKAFLPWSWLGESEQKDMNEIRDVCSQYFHGDHNKRSQALAMIACTPVVIIDQLLASLCLGLSAILLLPIRSTVGLSDETDSFVRGVGKSIGGLVSAIGYYIVWVVGGNFAKAVVLGALLINQALYSAILLRMSFSEFVQLALFRGIFWISFVQIECSMPKAEEGMPGHTALGPDGKKRGVSRSVPMDANPMADENSATLDGSSHEEIDTTFETEESGTSLFEIVGNLETQEKLQQQRMITDSVLQSQDSMNLGIRESGEVSIDDVPTFYGQENDSVPDIRVVPSADTYLTNHNVAAPGSRGTKCINFAGEIYSPRVDHYPDLSPNKSKCGLDGQSCLLGIYNTFKEEIEDGLFSNNEPEVLNHYEEKLGRHGTASTKAASYMEREDDAAGSAEKMTILHHIKPSALDVPFTLSDDSGQVFDNSSVIHTREERDEAPDDRMLPTTFGAEAEISPPRVAALFSNGNKKNELQEKPEQSMFALPASLLGGVGSGVASDNNKTKKSKKRNRHTDAPAIPTHVNMLDTVRSIDEEELTLIGNFEGPILSIDHVPPQGEMELEDTGDDDNHSRRRGGRRPAPSKVDIPSDELPISLASMSTERCDQFVYDCVVIQAP